LNCDVRHSGGPELRVLLTQVGNDPMPREKQGNDMTDLNNEVRELSIDELDKVSGGGKDNPLVDVTVNKAIAASKAAALADAYIRG
jgi:hypothetical protein